MSKNRHFSAKDMSENRHFLQKRLILVRVFKYHLWFEDWMLESSFDIVA